MRGKPKMTRAHFELIADTIDNLAMFQSDKQAIAQAFVDSLRATNPAFDSHKFYERATRLNDDV